MVYNTVASQAFTASSNGKLQGPRTRLHTVHLQVIITQYKTSLYRMSAVMSVTKPSPWR